MTVAGGEDGAAQVVGKKSGEQFIKETGRADNDEGRPTLNDCSNKCWGFKSSVAASFGDQQAQNTDAAANLWRSRFCS